MSTANAFARKPVMLQSDRMEHAEEIARKPKRPRLSDDGFAAMQTKCAPEDTSLEIDHMILDYIAYRTIKACLASRNLERQEPSSTSLSANLSMFNAFLSIFRARNARYKTDPELKFRIKLLKLVTLYTQRLTLNPTTPSATSIQSMRVSNKERAASWIQATNDPQSSSILDTRVLDDELPVRSLELEQNREQTLKELGIPLEDEASEEPFYGTALCLSLLDILPLFMEASAARNVMNASNLSERWMHLASEFMLQACLEQYLAFGAQSSDPIEEAFAWGYEASSDHEINDMFEDEEYAVEVMGWSEIKVSYLKQLLTSNATTRMPNSSDIEQSATTLHLKAVAVNLPIAVFETSVLEFLEALSKSIPLPVLAQLESGSLDGMTVQETQEFLADCGVNIARLFEP